VRGRGQQVPTNTTTAANSGAPTSPATAKPAGSVNFTGSFCGDGKNAISNNAFGATAGATEQSTLQKNLDLLNKFKAEAPSEIKSDVATVVDFYSKFVQAMASANGDPTKMEAALAPLQSQEAGVQAAGQRIDAYVTAHCK